jgi:hypothetical protein
MFDDFIDILHRGSYEVGLPTLMVTGQRVGQLRGSGQISWTSDAGIRVQGVTDGAAALNALLFGGFEIPGRLIPHSQYLTFSGRTQDGWEVSTDQMPQEGFYIHTDLPDVVWDLVVTGTTFHRETTGDTARFLRILMGPSPRGWPRGTETEIRNEFFGARSSCLDWLVTTTSIGRVAARQRSDEWFEVLVMPDDNTPMRDPFVVCGAVARAFAFILGRRCVIRGYEEINENNQTRRINAHDSETTKNSILQPLGWQLELRQNIERLLGQAIDFFLTEVGQQVATYLFLCWDTADNAYQTRLAISAICVEGLLRLAASTLGPSQPMVIQTDIAAFEEWLNSKPVSFTPQFLNRLSGLTGMFKSISANEIFRDWVNRGVLGVTKEDAKAWSETRHPAAHGQLSDAESQDELQVRITRHTRVQNLLNKIVLRLIGYSGVYIDYSQPGFSPAIFPGDELQPEGAMPAAGARTREQP